VPATLSHTERHWRPPEGQIGERGRTVVSAGYACRPTPKSGWPPGLPAQGIGASALLMSAP